MQRLQSNSFWHRLTEDQRKLYKSGLPVKFLGTQLRELRFLPYYHGSELTKRVCSAAKQMQTLIDFANSLRASSDYSCLMAMHSAPTDEAAFRAAAAIYEAAAANKLLCRCVSTTTLIHDAANVPAADVYLIHGVMDGQNHAAIWALRDFLRDRDGSLRMVVMTSSKELYLDTLIHDQLRMHFDYLYCLDDLKSEVVVGQRTNIQHA